MNWTVSHRADPAAVRIADRHYNRQKPGTPQFVPPGSCMVLVIPDAAVWVTSWPKAEYVKHRWAGAWVNSFFRNERSDLYLSSDLIRQALAATRWFYGEPPALGLVTFIDREKTRRKRDPGRCYIRAGAEYDGETEGGLVAVRFRPEVIPAALEPIRAQAELQLNSGS